MDGSLHSPVAVCLSQSEGARPAAPVDPAFPRRVVFLSASSGGGHDGTARALQALMTEARPGPRSFQLLDIYPRIGWRLLPWLSRVRHRSNWIWSWFYRITGHPLALRLLQRLMAGPIARAATRRVEGEPDLLVATHFVAAQVIEAVAAGLARRPSTIIVATDYRPHRAWFGKADVLLLARDDGIESAMTARPSGQAIATTPLLPCLPCHPRTSRASGESSRDRLQLIVVMGADGTSGGRLLGLLGALVCRPWSGRLHLEVVCGRNDRLARAVARWAQGDGPAKGDDASRCTVEVLGHVSDLPQRLADADICLLRASPLVITEALAAGTPLLAFDWAAHEEANARLIERWGCGRASRSIDAVVDTLETWTTREESLAQVRAGARRMADQTFGIAQMERLLTMVETAGNQPCAIC